MLRSESFVADNPTDLDTSIQMNVNIAGNTVINTTHNYGSHIGIVYSNDDGASPQGLGATGIVVRNNTLQANMPAITLNQEDLVNYEGYGNFMSYNWWSGSLPPYSAPKDPGLLATIFQGNACKNCPIVYRTGADVFASVYLNSSLTNSGSGGLVKQINLPPNTSGSQGDYIK
jgi:hypothetical protein